MMRRTALSVTVALAFGATACTESQMQDVETDYEVAQANTDLVPTAGNPDSLHTLRNVNGFPNLTVVCYEGVAVVTHSREGSPLRVPELDRTCPDATSEDGR